MIDEDSPEPTPALLRTPLVAPRRATPANDQPAAPVAKPVSEISALVEAVDAQQATIESQGKLIDKLLARIEVMDKLLGRIVDLEKAFEELPIFELMAAANALKGMHESRAWSCRLRLAGRSRVDARDRSTRRSVAASATASA
jgi:hypothetical protein